MKYAMGVESLGYDSQVSALGDTVDGTPQAKQSRRRSSERKGFSLKTFKFKTESWRSIK